MDCEKVRDRFSSLWEKELMPSEEKTIREHLSSCPECQKELERFGKTMGWLRSVRDVEVPEGFLPELYKKIEERKKARLAGESKGKWFIFPLSFKLPVQAVAMVAIVLLVLYLSKMMPMEVSRLKENKQTSSPVLVEKKSEQVSVQNEMEKEGRATETLPETPRSKEVAFAKAPVPGKEKLKEAHVPQGEVKAKKVEAPVAKNEVMAYQQIDPEEAAKAKAPSPEPGKIEKELVVKEKSVVASKPPQEILLRISNREKVVPQLQELVKYFGGEMVTEEGNRFLVSLPTHSFPEFEKELVGLSAFTQTDKGMAKKQTAGSLRAAPEMKREEVGERSKEPTKLATDQEGRTAVLILLIPQ
jgi:Putative zinc-finger